MRRDVGGILMACFIILFVIFSLGYYVKSSSDCREKNGHFARDAYTGIYKCYDKEILNGNF